MKLARTLQQARMPIWVPCILCLMVLTFDLITPRSVSGSIAYIPLIFSAMWITDLRAGFALAAITTLLTIMGGFIASSDNAPIWIALVNRSFTISALWLAAMLVYLRRKSESAYLASEEQLHKVDTLFAAIVESSMDPIISKDMHGVITSWNKAASQLFGYSATEAIGQHISLLIPSERMREELHILSQVQAGIKVEHFETRRRKKDGSEIDVSLTVSPIRDMNGVIVGASKILRDISERKETEKLHEQLRHIQKLESLGQLTGGIAHDFNNLLAVILGNLDFLAERTEENDPLREFIRPGITAAEYGASLTKQLLAFSRKQSLQPKTISVNEMLQHFSTLVRHTLGERIETILSLDDHVWNIHADPSQLQNALLNLAVNARDAMPEGGRLVIETSNVTLDKDYVAHNADAISGEYALIAISDSGEGMDSATLEKSIEPFFTTKEVGRGSGLGLSMVYGFVKQSSGHIKLYSELGHGTTIKIYLPRADGAAIRLDSPDTRPLSTERKKQLVLVVEDNKEVLKLTAAMVKDLGYDVLQAETADIAMAILEVRSDIDLLLSDVMLPGILNGPSLAKKALALRPQLKVLFNSGYAEHAIMKSGLLDEGVNLISKPFRKQQLGHKIEEVLAA